MFQFTDRYGIAQTGEIWSPGPVAGTVWVLPTGDGPPACVRLDGTQARLDAQRSSHYWQDEVRGALQYGRRAIGSHSVENTLGNPNFRKVGKRITWSWPRQSEGSVHAWLVPRGGQLTTRMPSDYADQFALPLLLDVAA
jgi:hypothetical protein